ncbi:type IV toxin-antitoxin system AbiEi family antitoxin, partial [Steroidobacter sp.]|uniref:type IV toxin-antitoxin system AbiEi family antitoxin n=1 Tax=Steroidobacter sp. TaxID=1978227 RepID=UPI0025FEFF8B
QANPADAFLELRHAGRTLKYTAEVKRRLRPATLGAVIHQVAVHGDNALLVSDHVTPPLADQLRARGVQFIDTAGNAFLNAPPILIWVKGEKPAERLAPPRDRGRAFAATGLQVVFALLCKPEATNLSYREIARLAGVAHGTVGWIIPELQELRFIAQVGEQRRLMNVDRLLRQWAEGYIQTLRPKLVLGRYQAPTLEWWSAINPRKYEYMLGGEAAAGRLTKHLRPGAITVYGAKVEPRFLLDQKLSKDADGQVEILKRFWHFDEEKELAPIPLIYADLIQTNDARCLEAAQILHDRFIAGFERKS